MGCSKFFHPEKIPLCGLPYTLSSVCWKKEKCFSTPNVHYSSSSFSIWQTASVLTDFSSEMSPAGPVIVTGEGLSRGGYRLMSDVRTAGASGVNIEEVMSIKATLLVGEKHRLSHIWPDHCKIKSTTTCSHVWQHVPYRGSEGTPVMSASSVSSFFLRETWLNQVFTFFSRRLIDGFLSDKKLCQKVFSSWFKGLLRRGTTLWLLLLSQNSKERVCCTINERNEKQDLPQSRCFSPLIIPFLFVFCCILSLAWRFTPGKSFELLIFGNSCVGVRNLFQNVGERLLIATPTTAE